MCALQACTPRPQPAHARPPCLHGYLRPSSSPSPPPPPPPLPSPLQRYPEDFRACALGRDCQRAGMWQVNAAPLWQPSARLQVATAAAASSFGPPLPSADLAKGLLLLDNGRDGDATRYFIQVGAATAATAAAARYAASDAARRLPLLLTPPCTDNFTPPHHHPLHPPRPSSTPRAPTAPSLTRSSRPAAGSGFARPTGSRAALCCHMCVPTGPG